LGADLNIIQFDIRFNLKCMHVSCNIDLYKNNKNISYVCVLTLKYINVSTLYISQSIYM